jgi:hypothetical protein
MWTNVNQPNRGRLFTAINIIRIIHNTYIMLQYESFTDLLSHWFTHSLMETFTHRSIDWLWLFHWFSRWFTPLVRWFTDWWRTHSMVHWPIPRLIHSFISFFYVFHFMSSHVISFIHSFVRSFIHSLCFISIHFISSLSLMSFSLALILQMPANMSV